MERWTSEIKRIFKPTNPMWAMWVLMGLGFLLRVWGQAFGLPNDAWPPEGQMIQVVLRNLIYPLQHGDWQLHPYYFNVPSLPLYGMALVYLLLYAAGTVLGMWPGGMDLIQLYELDPTVFHLLLRGSSALAGTLLIPVTFALGRRLINEPVGWIAAVLMMVSYLMVRTSHLGSFDTWLALGSALSLLLLLRYQEHPTSKNIYIACVCIGLTMGVHYGGLLLWMPLWVSLLQPYIQPARIAWLDFLEAVVLPTGMCLLVFLLTSPWWVLDFQSVLMSIQLAVQSFFLPIAPGTPTGWVFYSQWVFWVALGVYTLVFGLLGVGLAARQPDKTRHWMLWSFALGYVLLLGWNGSPSSRFAVPLVPVMLVYAAWGVEFLGARIASLLDGALPDGLSKKRVACTGMVALVALYQPLMNSLEFDRLLSQPDTRTLAREWILGNIEANQPVAAGPLAGRIHLPPAYGLLLMETQATFFQAPQDMQLLEWNPRTQLTNTYSDLAKLRELGIRYVVLYLGLPLYSMPARERQSYEQAVERGEARLVFMVQSLSPAVDAALVRDFEVRDGFYMPLVHLQAFERPGPQVLIFELLPAQEAGAASGSTS